MASQMTHLSCANLHPKMLITSMEIKLLESILEVKNVHFFVIYY